jgi:1,4-dihydroxy-6-naphthoate synthase
MMNIDIAISTCPNDTYIFGGMLSGRVESNYNFDIFMDDVQVLNKLALQQGADIIKVSYGVVPEILDNYRVLKSGGALGFGCGPLVVAKNNVNISELKGQKIAIPGVNTSAYRFFKMFFGTSFDFVELRFDYIMPAIQSGEVAAGVIIHEGRFVYEQMGLFKLCDLGNLFEEKFNSPIPLGAIVIRKELAEEADNINNTIRKSIDFANSKYEQILPFIKEHAQEMEEDVIKQHIDLYVNEYSVDVTPAIPALCNFLDTDNSIFI